MLCICLKLETRRIVVGNMLIFCPKVLARKDKDLNSQTLDHEVRKISGCWMNAKINKD